MSRQRHRVHGSIFCRANMSTWWKRFPVVESRSPRLTPIDGRPALSVGTLVRLEGKPDRVRRVLNAEWHFHRYEFVYVVETTPRSGTYVFAPYWFLDQLVVENGENANTT